MSEFNNKCPGCVRQCDLSSPSCPRGEAFARGQQPDEMTSTHSPREGHRHGAHGRPDEFGRHDKPGERGSQHHLLEAEQYSALSTEEKLGVQLRELGRMARFHMESSGGQGRILSILAWEGGMTQRALTEKLGIQPGSASEVIGKLERAGFIERSENESDRRTSDIRLTDAGRAQTESESDEQPKLFSALSAEEQQQLLALLEKLTADWKVRFPRKGPGRDDFHGHKGDRRRENHSGNHR